jgi:ammonium transporter, Amt family
MPESPINTGDTAWILMASALVLFMTPGLAFFYGGLVRQKNVLSTIMHSFFAMGLISIIWMAVGYTLGFGPSQGNFIGGFDYLFLHGVSSMEPGPVIDGVALSGATPHMLYMAFQLMFAIITPALISGAFAERMKFSAMVLFYGLWSILVYSPIAHWVWGGGWLFDKGVLDFAGGTVVHINAGVAALCCALYLGKRRGWPKDVAPPHNVPFCVLGAGILWFGWFGFNGGSALSAGSLATGAFVATHFAAAGALVMWAICERMKHGKVTTVGVATGAVAGLVAVTPAAGFVEPWAGLAIGLGAGLICFFAINLKNRFGYDDALDVVGVHLVGGVVGALLTGVFANKAFSGIGDNGLLFGNPSQFVDQAIGVGATIVFSGIMSFALLFIVDKLVGVRCDEEDELQGLDLSQHSESAYSYGDSGAHMAGSSAAPSRQASPF